jgi:hypothetical protein
MICYCTQHTSTGFQFWLFFVENWSSIDPYGIDDNQYCTKWLTDSIINSIISVVSSTSMIVLNALIAVLFAKLGKFKKKHTTIEE